MQPPSTAYSASSQSSLSSRPPRPQLSFKDIAKKVLDGEVRLTGTPQLPVPRSYTSSPEKENPAHHPSDQVYRWSENRAFSRSENNILTSASQSPERVASNPVLKSNSLRNVLPSQSVRSSNNGWVARDPTAKPPALNERSSLDEREQNTRNMLRFGIARQERREQVSEMQRQAKEQQVRENFSTIQKCYDLKFLADSQAWQVAEQMERIEVAPLLDVAKADKKFFRLYVVMSGLLEASLYGESQRLIGPGEVIGESIHIHSGMTSIADVRVRSKSQLLSIHATDFLKIIDRTSVIFYHEKPEECDIDQLNPGRKEHSYDRHKAIKKVFGVPTVVSKMREWARTSSEGDRRKEMQAMRSIGNLNYNSLEEDDDVDQAAMQNAQVRHGIRQSYMSIVDQRRSSRRLSRSESPTKQRTKDNSIKAILRERPTSQELRRAEKHLQWRSPNSGGIADQHYIE